MVVIRLSRCGAKHRPKYRVTVADSRRSAKGRFIEVIGQYNTFVKDKKWLFKWILKSTKNGYQKERNLVRHYCL